jgi:hypothetical protein
MNTQEYFQNTILSLHDLNRNNNQYLHVDVVENAIDSLETAASLLNRDDNLKWKWFVFALHHSLYSFCISCLENGNYDNVLGNRREIDEDIIVTFDELLYKKSIIKKRPHSPGYTIDWIDTRKPEQVEINNKEQKKRKNLINFWTALARVQDSFYWMGKMICYKALKLSEEEWESIEWITLTVRNNITHFVPCSFSISINSIKKTSMDLLRVIKFLALESNAVLYLDYEKRRKRIINSITIIKNHLINV